MAEYRSQYYALKSSISEQKITIEDALKIRMLNNLGPAFKTYLTVVNDQMRTDEKLEDDEVLFKAIEDEKTRMKVGQKASANFASTKSKSQGNSEKKTFSEGPSAKNVAANTCEIQHADLLTRNAINATKRGIFLDFMTAIRPSISPA